MMMLVIDAYVTLGFSSGRSRKIKMCSEVMHKKVENSSAIS